MECPVEAEQVVLSAYPTVNKEPHYRANAIKRASQLQKVPKSAQVGAKTVEAGSCGSSAYADQHACEHNRPDPETPYATNFGDIDFFHIKINGSGMAPTSACKR